jgi:hypothetical protein
MPIQVEFPVLAPRLVELAEKMTKRLTEAFEKAMRR